MFHGGTLSDPRILRMYLGDWCGKSSPVGQLDFNQQIAQLWGI
jgi:hypothetical protein